MEDEVKNDVEMSENVSAKNVLCAPDKQGMCVYHKKKMRRMTIAVRKWGQRKNGERAILYRKKTTFMCLGGGQLTAGANNVPGEGSRGNLEVMAPDVSTFVGTKPNSGCTGVKLPDCTPEAWGSPNFTQVNTVNKARGG